MGERDVKFYRPGKRNKAAKEPEHECFETRLKANESLRSAGEHKKENEHSVQGGSSHLRYK